MAHLYNCRNNFIRKMCVYTKQCIVANENYPNHVPVMAEEALESLKPEPGNLIIDMTFGAGGHTQKILESDSSVKVVALDRDPIAYNLSKTLSQKYPDRLIPLLGRFSELPALLKLHNIRQNSVDGILFDFGCSSMQFDIAERGFSISKDGPLDMRMDGYRFPDQPTAADVLARADEIDIAKILRVYGEEKQCKKIARAIVESRYTFKKLETTGELAELVSSVCEEDGRLDKLQRFSHSATKTFQALRIFVNNELNEINYAMLLSQKYLKLGGRIVSICFHSLEDRIVKRHLMGHLTDNVANTLPLKYSSHMMTYSKDTIDSLMESCWKPMYKHVLTPTFDEIESNPRSRSAKFRAAVRIK